MCVCVSSAPTGRGLPPLARPCPSAVERAVASFVWPAHTVWSLHRPSTIRTPHALAEVTTIWDARSGAKLRTFTDMLLWPLEFSTPPTFCSVAIGLGRALDPHGFGEGLSWRELQ